MFCYFTKTNIVWELDTSVCRMLLPLKKKKKKNGRNKKQKGKLKYEEHELSEIEWVKDMFADEGS